MPTAVQQPPSEAAPPTRDEVPDAMVSTRKTRSSSSSKPPQTSSCGASSPSSSASSTATTASQQPSVVVTTTVEATPATFPAQVTPSETSTVAQQHQQQAPILRPAVTNDDCNSDNRSNSSTSRSNNNKRGLVSRRGRGFAGMTVHTTKSVVEYPTFRHNNTTATTTARHPRSPLPTEATTPANTDTPTRRNIPEDEKLATTPKSGGHLSPHHRTVTASASFDNNNNKKKERDVATPTDFAQDYTGQKITSTGSFDTSNVLAWLQSPTTNGLFSPGTGEYSSLLHTPGRPRTPRTPVVSTSFFFSDVASLPAAAAADENGTPARSKKPRKISNIICISPLASSKATRTPTATTNNLKDVFLSPPKTAVRSLPLLDDTKRVKTATSKDPSVDAVLLAERDLMEDEDMSVMLQLASNSTPRNGQPPVFRSPPKPKNPALQLPMIGGARKKNCEEDDDDDDDAFRPPQLGMRSAAASKENKKDPDADDEKATTPKRVFPLTQQPYPPPEMAPYYPMVPPSMTGSVRVVVGKQPSTNSPSRYPEYPYPHHPHHHPHMYPYPPPHMGGYAPYSYPPPPPQHRMGMYNGAMNKKGKKNKPGATGKRAAVPTPVSSSKKKRSPGNKKRKSPPVEGVEREKAAASVHAVNAASGGKNDKAAALAAAILRGVTMRPSGKWQAQLYFAGKSRYIGVFDSREKAALAYEIAREKLKSGPNDAAGGSSTENLVNAARKAAFDGVNESLKG